LDATGSLGATFGVVVGTALGTRVLTTVPEPLFRRIVALLLIVLGVSMTLSDR
jgi:uncharacterized membrane protein YfcA